MNVPLMIVCKYFNCSTNIHSQCSLKHFQFSLILLSFFLYESACRPDDNYESYAFFPPSLIVIVTKFHFIYKLHKMTTISFSILCHKISARKKKLLKSFIPIRIGTSQNSYDNIPRKHISSTQGGIAFHKSQKYMKKVFTIQTMCHEKTLNNVIEWQER